MILGILSDSHDNLDTLGEAIELFRARGVSHILHAGDWVSPFAAAEVAAAGIPFTGVFGNNDGDKILLAKVTQGRILRAGAALELGGWLLVMLHEPDNIEALAASGRYRLIVHGHDHRPRIETRGASLIINPGECGGWVTGEATVATLDTTRGLAEIHRLRARIARDRQAAEG